MKKTISLLLAIVLCLSLCACEQNSTPSDNQTAEALTEAIKEERRSAEFYSQVLNALRLYSGQAAVDEGYDEYDEYDEY